MTSEKEWITVPETLNLLQIKSRTTLYKLLYKHKIRVTKPLGKKYVNKEDINKILIAGSVTLGV